MSCDVTPDRGLFGLKYALAYTIPDFEKKLLVRWDKDHKEDHDYLNKKFDLFCSCPQGTATTKWNFVSPSTKAQNGPRRTPSSA